MQGVIEINIPNIPAVVALDSVNKRIAFTKQHKTVFVDYQDGCRQAIWKDKVLDVGGVSYDYQTWHSVVEDSDLKNYFKTLLQKVWEEHNGF